MNATPLGAHGEALPLPPLGPSILAVDLLLPTREHAAAKRRPRCGRGAFGGLGLLLHQAALSIELWTGQPAPLEAMSAAAIGAIGTGA